MIEKWERHPMRIGMLAGFVLLPLLWCLQEHLLHFVFGFNSAFNFQLINYFAAGAFQGIILGAGVSKAAFAARYEDWGDAKWCLISHGAIALTFSIVLLMPSMGRNIHIFLLTYLPLHGALLLLFIGIAMRSRR